MSACKYVINIVNFIQYARPAALIVLLIGSMIGFSKGVSAQAALPSLSSELLAAAEKGDPYSSFIAGQLLLAKGDAGSLKKALVYLTYAHDGYLAAEGDDRRWAGDASKLLGDVHSRLANYAKAVEHFQRATRELADFGHLENVGIMRGLIAQGQGIVLLDLSRYDESISLFEHARSIFAAEAGPQSVYQGDTYLNEGIAREGMGQFQISIDRYKKALAIYTKAFGPESAQAGYAINNIGWVFRRMDRFVQSENWLKRALPIVEKLEGRISDSAGKIRINLGIVSYLQGNTDEAIHWTMGAMPFMVANRSTTLSDQRWAFDNLARAFRAKDDVKKATVFAKLAVNAQQTIRAQNASLSNAETQNLRQEWRRLYEHLAELLIEQGRISEAQAVLNMTKEQEVFEFLRRDASADVANTKSVLTDEELGTESQVEALSEAPLEAALELRILLVKIEADTATTEDEDRVAELQDIIQASVDKFEQDVEAFLATVETTKEESLRDQFDAIDTYQDILDDLGGRSAILQIASVGDATHLFLTLSDLSVHRKLELPKAELSKMVLDALQAIERQSPDAQSELAALHDVIFKPVSHDLKKSGVDVIMLNLDGFLRYVPFAALFDGKNYLVEKYAFALYSPTIPTQFKTKRRRASKTAGFGVTRAHPNFSALPGVREELETIFSGEDKKGILSGPTNLDERFDERNLKRTLLKKPTILHIASHFSLVPGRENDSFLLLGDGKHLPLSEIRQQKALSFRGIDLLTLSACQTARGGDGSEIEGFGATAQLNGASSVLASLWPVADDATPRLMHDFYRTMMVDGLTKAEALRQAQIAMLTGAAPEETVPSAERGAASRHKQKQTAIASGENRFAHPYFWSPFVLMGNWL